MAHRPTYIDLRSHTDGGGASGTSSPAPQPSPRIHHVAGDVPPTMSPLDAFAMQSRLLAKQLEGSKTNGRRASRLPPLTVADSLAKQRPGYFRSLSTQPGGESKADGKSTIPEHVPGSRMEVESPAFRPRSFYPRMSGVPSIRSGQTPSPSPLAHDQSFQTPREYQPQVQGDYFGAARAQSPEPLRKSMESSDHSSTDKNQGSFDPLHRTTELTRDLSLDSTSSRGHYSQSLQPPNPPFARQTPSLRSIPMDSSDDENPRSNSGSSMSQNRKLSSSSGVSMPQSPLSPFNASHIRSPSAHSERSVSSSRLSRPAFNFSRPLSRSNQPSMEFSSRQASSDSGPSVEYPSRQASSDSRPSIELSFGEPSSDSQIHIFTEEDGMQTPASFENEDFFDSKTQQTPAVPSYIYAKYSLPRGRMLGRDSMHLDQMMPAFDWEQSQSQGSKASAAPAPSPDNASLPTPPHSIESDRQALGLHGRASVESADSRSALESSERASADSNNLRPSQESSQRPSADYNSYQPIRPHPAPTLGDQHRHSMTSMNSGSTIKAPERASAPSTEMTAEDHLNKGIECHERGSLKESTYHLRIAARQNNATAMLLYALACRHGWGMRQSPEEGVKWLRKAMDSASIELDYDADNANRGTQAEVTERKTRRAQFALSVYELGVSHMNGWGTEQDKALALRCFEIASDWGDADAMAEAGFCFAQGVGCKKDLKKAAKYYRKAEARGMSMVGNSWYGCSPKAASMPRLTRSRTNPLLRIYKPKYADDSADRSGRAAHTTTAEKKSRDKSRTRTLFGRKKSAV
ncbi:hypothetical protein MMC11_000169 [Xylographa trunciseda]|nr:hypothetical protein [Xylographa trunciseda]